MTIPESTIAATTLQFAAALRALSHGDYDGWRAGLQAAEAIGEEGFKQGEAAGPWAGQAKVSA